MFNIVDDVLVGYDGTDEVVELPENIKEIFST